MKTTHNDLAAELTKLDEAKYALIISKAKSMAYHDFKSELALPKTELVNDLAKFPELNEMRESVMAGGYDESPDDEDVEDMRRDLKEDGASEEFLKIFGL